jgi:hypothetical protein
MTAKEFLEQHYKVDDLLELATPPKWEEIFGLMEGYKNMEIATTTKLPLDTIAKHVTASNLSVHAKIANLWVQAGHNMKSWPNLPPDYLYIRATFKNGTIYKGRIVPINNWGGVKFLTKKWMKNVYLPLSDIDSWEFI